MSDLEALSNKELRAKCMEYGMPNVPVTDTSRKVLIRRLEAVMSGKPVTPAQSNRRETMHVSKPSEIASSTKISKNNNVVDYTKPTTPSKERPSRRTIAVPERHVATTTTVSEPEYSDVSPDRGEEPSTTLLYTPKTVEKAPMQQRPMTQEKAPMHQRPMMQEKAPMQQIPITLERPNLYPKLPTKEPSPKPQMLSKTGVVTTSFVHEQRPTSYNTEEKARKPAVSVPSVSTYVQPTVSSSTRYSSLGSPYYNFPSDSISGLSSTSNMRKTVIGEPSITSSYGLSSTATQRYSQYGEADMGYEDNEEEDEDDEVVEIQDSPVGEGFQTPYLSQFARNLENLKATPLRHSLAATQVNPILGEALRQRGDNNAYKRRTMAGSYAGNIKPRRSFQDAQMHENSPIREFLWSLEQRYHIKQGLFIVSIFVFAIFIYVFFIQSN